MQIIWKSPNVAGTKYYRLEVEPLSIFGMCSSGSGVEGINIPATQNSSVFSGLKHGVQYTVVITAVGCEGVTRNSIPLNFTAPAKGRST